MRLDKTIWPYSVNIPVDHLGQTILDCECWLEENMGEMCDRWYVASYGTKKAVYYFRTEQDAVWFTLRWA